jgi:hypothetical protein
VREGALADVFDIGDNGVEFLGDLADIHDGMRDLAKFVNDPKGLKGVIPNIFDPNDLNAGPFLQKIGSLRGQVERQVTDSFAAGGAPAATKTANEFVNQLFQTLGGKVSKGDIATLLGLDDIEAKIKVALDEKTMRQAKEELDILTGLQGVTPYTATIALALAEGTLSADAAKVLIEQEFKRVGVVVPASVTAPPDESTRAAQAEAQRFIDNNKSTMTTKLPSTVAQATNAAEARAAAQAEIDKLLPVVFASAIAKPPVKPFFDAGGTTGQGGGIVGERRPEIINNRFLVTEPSWVPPGTRVTSGARTARILRTRGTRGLRRYDSGGMVPGAAPNVTVNFNGVGNIGNRYDTDRQIKRSIQRIERIYGTRG